MNDLLKQATFLLAIVSVGAGTLDRIQVQDQWMIDSNGRVRLFHGFNSVKKGPPWYDQDILNVTKLQLYHDWGFNAVRLGTMWKGIEPMPNVFNSTFLSLMQTIVRTLEAHGLYVILDMHQDTLSIFNDSNHNTVGYEGIPRWLLEKFPPCQHPFPWPFKVTPPDEHWAQRYFTEAISVAFQQLYNNTAGAVEYLSGFWTKVASIFKDQSSVLGYEFINEPWAGDVFHYPVLWPGVAGKMNLAPFYNRLSSAIRSVDNKSLIFYEPVTWGIIGNGEILGTGFDTVPGGTDYRDRSVLSYHYYCWIINNAGTHYDPLERFLCDRLLGPRVMQTVMNDIRQTGGSSFLTEFGLCAPDGDPESINTVECEFILSLTDRFLQSWTYWDSQFFDDVSGGINWNVVKPFARVYARAVAGIPRNMTFDLETKCFHFEYFLNTSIIAPTEIFIPQIHYPEGFHVNVSAPLVWKFDEGSRVLEVMQSSYSKSSGNVFVDVSAKNRKC